LPIAERLLALIAPSLKFGVQTWAMTYTPKDRFFHMAKADGFKARSAYKLTEIQKKFRVLNSGNFVLDCGAAPGSWSQVVSQTVGPSGHVVGLDLKEIDLSLKNGTFYVMDVFQFDPQILKGRTIDCLLSDMAPNTTGIRSVDQARSAELCSKMLELSDKHLKPRGNLVMKLFEGPEAEAVAKEVGKKFASSKRFKPEAVRKGSYETYLIGIGKK
jgi:23S rRNA (uridine2552-2'-O)-methyltransferase